MEDDAFYTVEELAKRWKVNEETVRRFIRRGDLASMMLSRKGGHRIPVAEVARFEDDRVGVVSEDRRWLVMLDSEAGQWQVLEWDHEKRKGRLVSVVPNTGQSRDDVLDAFLLEHGG